MYTIARRIQSSGRTVYCVITDSIGDNFPAPPYLPIEDLNAIFKEAAYEGFFCGNPDIERVSEDVIRFPKRVFKKLAHRVREANKPAASATDPKWGTY